MTMTNFLNFFLQNEIATNVIAAAAAATYNELLL